MIGRFGPYLKVSLGKIPGQLQLLSFSKFAIFSKPILPSAMQVQSYPLHPKLLIL